MRSDVDRLHDILDAIAAIQETTPGLDKGSTTTRCCAYGAFTTS